MFNSNLLQVIVHRFWEILGKNQHGKVIPQASQASCHQNEADTSNWNFQQVEWYHRPSHLVYMSQGHFLSSLDFVKISQISILNKNLFHDTVYLSIKFQPDNCNT